MSKKTPTYKKVINGLFAGATVAYIGIALSQQLRKPKQERTWQGTIAGIPYDFKLPSAERIQEAYWNEQSKAILQPKPLGIGWTINLYPLAQRLRTFI